MNVLEVMELLSNNGYRFSYRAPQPGEKHGEVHCFIDIDSYNGDTAEMRELYTQWSKAIQQELEAIVLGAYPNPPAGKFFTITRHKW